MFDNVPGAAHCSRCTLRDHRTVYSVGLLLHYGVSASTLFVSVLNDNDNDIALILRMLSCEYVHMRVNITDIHYRLYNRNRHEQTDVDRKLTNGASSSRYVVHTP